jgi:hypothetical protein
VDELITRANITQLRQLLANADLTAPERESLRVQLGREQARLFAGSIQTTATRRD